MGNNSLIEATVAVLGRACLGFLFKLLTTQQAPQTRTDKDKDDFTAGLDAYHETLSRVGSEREAIISAVQQAIEQNYAEPRSVVAYGFFPESSTNFTSRILELFKVFSERVNTYPKFSAEEARNDPQYVSRVTESLLEYHEDIKKQFQELMLEIDHKNNASCQSVAHML